MLFLGNQFFFRDLLNYYYPTKFLLRETILSGQFPFWNRFYSAGQPMAANPEYEVFYPLQWITLLPDYDFAFRAHIVAHLYVAVLGMYGLLRSMRLRISSALFGAVSFALGGPFLSLVNLLPILFCFAWLPWILWFARRAMLRPNRRDFAIAAALLGVQNLIGEPTSLLQTWVLLMLVAAIWMPAKKRSVAIAAALIVAGGIAGMAQLLPAVGHVRDSVRSRPFPSEVATSWSLPFTRPFETISPHAFGFWHERGAWYWGASAYPRQGAPFLLSVYPGLLVAALLLAGLIVRPRGALAVAVILAVSYLVATGPLFVLFRRLPFLSSLRYPEKFFLTALFVAVAGASVMFDRMVAGDQRLARGLCWTLAALAAVLLVVAMLSTSSAGSALFGSRWTLAPSAHATAMAALWRSDAWIAVLRAVLFLAAVLFLRRRPREGLLVLGVLVVADLAWLSNGLLERMPAAFFSQPPSVAAVDAARGGRRLFVEAQWESGTPVERSYRGAGSASHWLLRNALLPMTPARWGIPTALEIDYDSTALLPTAAFLQSIWTLRAAGVSRWREMAMAMSGVGAVSSFRNPPAGPVHAEEFVPVDVRPVPGNDRYYFADSLESVAGFLARMGSASPRVAFVDCAMIHGCAPPGAGRILSVSERANDVHLAVDGGASAAFLVASVTRHQYWRAFVDGQERPIVPANLAYQGVLVPPGRHLVEWRYRNPMVVFGCGVSLAAFLAFVWIGIPKRRRGETLFVSVQDDTPPRVP